MAYLKRGGQFVDESDWCEIDSGSWKCNDIDEKSTEGSENRKVMKIERGTDQVSQVVEIAHYM